MEKDKLERVPNKLANWCFGFSYLVPKKKPTSYLGKKMEYFRDCFGISVFAISSLIKRYFRLILRAPFLSVFPGSNTRAIEFNKDFDRVNDYLVSMVFNGVKLVTYCTSCDFNTYKPYRYDCDSDFWEISQDKGSGVCMECAGKTQTDWLSKLDEINKVKN